MEQNVLTALENLVSVRSSTTAQAMHRLARYNAWEALVRIKSLLLFASEGDARRKATDLFVDQIAERQRARQNHTVSAVCDLLHA